MRTVKRTIVVRGSDGNDYTGEYNLPVYESIDELLQEFGKEWILDAANKRIEQDARQQHRVYVEFDAHERIRKQ